MRTTYLSTLLLFVCLITNAQTKLKFNSVSLGLGIFYINSVQKNANAQNLQQGGVSVTVETIVSLDQHLFSAQYLAGSEAAIFGIATFNVQEFGVQYGRSTSAQNWIKVEGFAGVGMFQQKDTDYKETTISFPLKVNIIFFPKGRINFGLNTNYSINSINNNLSGNLLLRYSFK